MLLIARYVIPVAEGPRDKRFIEHGAVLVKDDKIVEVGKASVLSALYPDEEVRDFGMAAIMPGFVDCHSHMEYACMRGILNDTPFTKWKAFIANKSSLLSDQDWEDSAFLGAYEAVTTGITTIADISATGASLRAADKLGMRGVIYREVSCVSRADVDPQVDAAMDDVSSWQEFAAGTGRFRIGVCPESLYTCHPRALRRLKEEACVRELPVALPIATSQEECDFIRYGSSPYGIIDDDTDISALEARKTVDLMPAGCTPVEYALNWDILEAPEVMAVHCVKMTDNDINVLKEYGVSVAACPRAAAKLGMGVAPIPAMRRAGIPVGLGTDSPAAADSIDLIDEMRFTMLVLRATEGKEGFIEGPDMIQMATLDAARALGMDHMIGSLEPGKKADIIAIDLSHSRQAPTHFPTSAVVHTADRDNVVMTMIDGQVVFDAHDPYGKILTADMRDMRRIRNNVERLRKVLRADLV